MQGEIYINASAVISRQKVFKNEVPVFESKDTGVHDFLAAVYHNFAIKYPKFYKMDNLCKLGLLTTEVLLQDSFDVAKYGQSEIGVVLSNASSSLDTDLKYFESAREFGSPALFVYTLPNIVIGEISIKHKLKGEHAFFIFEAFDAVFIQQYVTDLFSNNDLKACICGWVELTGEEYKAVLFLVEQDYAAGTIDSPGKYGPPKTFTAENLIKIYQTENG